MSVSTLEGLDKRAVSVNIPNTRSTETGRWACSFWLNSCDGKNMIVALSGYSAYFDASMNKPQDEMVVAGYLSTVEEWEQFEISWKLTLAMFSICGRDCAAQVRKYVRSIPSDLPIAFIFDRGDDGTGLLTEEMKTSGLPTPVFKRSRPDSELDKDDPYHAQLQACDLAAWELRRGESDLEEGRLPQQLRKSLLALNHGTKIWKQTLEPDLRGLIQVAGIQRRLA